MTVTTSRPLVFDRYGDNRTTGSFMLIDPATNFTAGAGMIAERRARRDRRSRRRRRRPNGSRARRATAATEADAIDAVRRVLEEMLT